MNAEFCEMNGGGYFLRETNGFLKILKDWALLPVLSMDERQQSR